MPIQSVILSTGSYLPEKIMTNSDLEKIVDTTDAWITQRSGIQSRHIAADDESTADLAIAAAKDAMERGNIDPLSIDGVIVATTTPDQTFPSVAVKVQAALGLPVGLAFDVQAVCTGFVYALATANNFIIAGQAKRILVVGAEKMSSIVDWTDRTTCVLFADGAGAVVLDAQEAESNGNRGVLSTHLYANGTMRDLLYTNGGPSSTGDAGHIIMHGREVFKYAVTYMADAVNEALAANDVAAADIDWLVPHQANIRIIEATAKKLDMDINKVVVTVDHHGNTSAASIPLALHEAVADGRIQQGQLVLLEAMGGGLTWGSALVRF
ncbi:MAG: ketoacyl-ACP synthase III [Alphaproteobacteria bacterium]|nr:ketoacyl-ACP synthase III [Alphaproteobacteria bacterium]